MSSFTFFDVETPNRTNGQICQIGVIRTDGQGHEEYKRSFYVDPQTYFDPFNVQLHGVSPRHVAGAPTLADLWERELASVFAGATLVAHNAKAVDLRILAKDLARYAIEPPEADYICTLAMARRNLRFLPSKGLASVASYYDVLLERHHDALSDTEACAGIFWNMVAEFGMPAPRHFVYGAPGSR